MGVLLGAVWSPCVGQTLWAAALLAAQKRHLPLVAMTMFAFSVRAVLPLLALGLLFPAVADAQARLSVLGGPWRQDGLGVVFVVVGLPVWSGLDEAMTPRWSMPRRNGLTN